jgi:hypothetical protein
MPRLPPARPSRSVTSLRRERKPVGSAIADQLDGGHPICVATPLDRVFEFKMRHNPAEDQESDATFSCSLSPRERAGVWVVPHSSAIRSHALNRGHNQKDGITAQGQKFLGPLP